MALQAQGNEMLEFSVGEEVEVQQQWKSSSGPAWSIGEFYGSWSMDLNISYQGNHSLEEETEHAYQIVSTWITLSDLCLGGETGFEA